MFSNCEPTPLESILSEVEECALCQAWLEEFYHVRILRRCTAPNAQDALPDCFLLREVN